MDRTDREKRFDELDDQIETLSVDEQNFMLWQLLKRYVDRLEIPKRVETIEEYRKYKVNHDLLVDCNELIDALLFELF